MATEIERKFLVKSELLPWGKMGEPLRIEQGYLSTDNPQIRIRRVIHDGAEYYLTIKGYGVLSRKEYEYRIPEKDAKGLFELCDSKGISKERYEMSDGWIVDSFNGELEGLYLAEIELPSEDAPLPSVPVWLGREVTDDERYYNVNLVEDGLPKES